MFEAFVSSSIVLSFTCISCYSVLRLIFFSLACKIVTKQGYFSSSLVLEKRLTLRKAGILLKACSLSPSLSRAGACILIVESKSLPDVHVKGNLQFESQGFVQISFHIERVLFATTDNFLNTSLVLYCLLVISFIPYFI